MVSGTEVYEPDMKSMIIETSMKLFADKGFDGTSMRDIAKSLEITLPTIYYYFGNKEGLWSSILQEVITRFMEVTAAAAVGVVGIRETLIAMGMAKHRFFAEHREMMLVYLRELYSPQSNFILNESVAKGLRMLETLVREGIERGEFRQVDPNLTAWYLMGVFSTFDMRIVASERVPSEEEIRTVVDLALDGIKKR